LFAYVILAAVTHAFNLDLSKVELHTWSKNIIIPLAILLVMSALSFRQLKIIGFRPILVFVFGSFIIAISAPLLVLLSTFFSETLHQIIIEEGYWKGLSTIVGSWIGGSTSQLVLKEVAECPDGLFLAILVLDNILVNIWTILMFQKIKRSDQLNDYFGIEDKIEDFFPDEVEINVNKLQPVLVTIGSCILVLILCHFFLIESFLMKIVILSFAGLVLGNFIRIWNHGLVLKIGGILILLIMAILGLKLNFSTFSIPLPIVGFTVVWLVLHYIFMMFLARKIKLHMAWVPIASMANLGGISTAPAVTAAYNEEWMPHAIVLAILSIVTGTAWGLLTIFLFQQMV
jgi:uncharacterized membrane protein